MNMELRLKVLEKSLEIEDFLSRALAEIIRVPDPAQSKSLGNRSSSLSFATKIALLNDLGYLPKEDYTNLMTFSEIRNQFIHNINCTNFHKALENNKGKLNLILELGEVKKLYNETSSEDLKEDLLAIGYSSLCIAIMQVQIKLIDKIQKALEEENFLKASKTSAEHSRIFLECMSRAIENTSKIYDNVLGEGDPDYPHKDKMTNTIWALFNAFLKKDNPDLFSLLHAEQEEET